MLSTFWRSCLLLGLCLLVYEVGLAQAEKRNKPQTDRAVPAKESTDNPTGEESVEDTLKISTDLVMVPITAFETTGAYATNLTRTDFSVWEDGVKQEVAFFATVNVPFHVVLMLDTSASTQEKLRDIRRAAIAFVDQLRGSDQVMVISFNDWVTELNAFSSDKAAVKAAINKTEAGQGTKLYDAFSRALDSVRAIRGRKAIVLFTDGVDRISDYATYDSTLRGLDEEGVIVYPIRYETRAETERIAREQASEQLPTLGVIRAPASGTTAPTFPSDEPAPTTGSRNRTGPFGLPTADEIMRRRRDEENRRERERYPRDNEPTPDPTRRRDPRDTPPSVPRVESVPDARRSTRTTSDDPITGMLDGIYQTADRYLSELERRSGGRLLRADTLDSLPAAFAQIAAELRTQYLIGYYPTNKERDGKYRRIKVASTRTDVTIRSRPGYASAP
jgi:VWFA-related protein